MGTMTSEETRKQIDDLKELLNKQKIMEQTDKQSEALAYVIRKLFDSFREAEFTHDEAWKLTEIWCVRNFGKE